MSAESLTSGFALDQSGMAGLKRLAKADPSKAAGEATKQFEAMFIQQILRSARSANPEAGETSEQMQVYHDLYDQQMAQHLASGKGFGLAKQIQAQLKARGLIDGDKAEYQENLIAGIPVAKPRRLTNALPTGYRATVGAEADEQTVVPSQKNPFAVASAATPSATAPVHVKSFVNRMSASAEKASQISGVPSKVILAQAALETGWGRHQIRTSGGGESFNLFGIKAGDHWKGKTASVVTTEYVDGEALRTVEKFRAYSSYEEAFSDYGRLIAESPRYARVVNAPNAQAAAYALQTSGYATDPAYGRKLVAVMDTMGTDKSTTVASAASWSRAIESSLGAGSKAVD